MTLSKELCWLYPLGWETSFMEHWIGGFICLTLLDRKKGYWNIPCLDSGASESLLVEQYVSELFKYRLDKL
jgi:hypothetical protein